MVQGYARVSTDGRSLAAEAPRLREAGAEKIFRETASGAQSDRPQLRRALAKLDRDDVFFVARLDFLARSTRDFLNTLATISTKGASFRSLGDAWADTTTAHGRLILTVLAAVGLSFIAKWFCGAIFGCTPLTRPLLAASGLVWALSERRWGLVGADPARPRGFWRKRPKPPRHSRTESVGRTTNRSA